MTETHTAKLFMNGSSQAVRLPKECRFDGKEVLVHKEGDRVILQPMRPDWEAFFTETPRASADFLTDRRDDAPQSRELF